MGEVGDSEIVREVELVGAARRGDERAMEALFYLHVASAVRLAYLITRDWATAEDATQEAFIRAFRSLKTFREGSPFRPWLTRIVINQARKAARRARRDLPLSEAGETADPNPTAEEMAMRDESQRHLRDSVLALDERKRLPVLLKYFGGFSEAEVAAILRLPVSTVKSRLYAARRQIRKTLTGVEGGERNAG